MKRNAIIRAFLAVALVLSILPKSNGDQAQYFYDDLGRLSGVADSAGNTAIYNYDAVGNLLSITRNTPPEPASAFIFSHPEADLSLRRSQFKVMASARRRRS